MTGKRRIDRILDPTLPDRVTELDTAAVRSLRDDCREEEARLSYLRRVLQARLDIAHAEVDRRGGEPGELLSRLPQILSKQQSGSRAAGRSLHDYRPENGEPRRRKDDRAVDEATFSRLPDLEADALEELLVRTAEYEAEVSAQRRQVLAHLDRLQEELVARYQDGRASIGEVLSPESGHEAF